MTTIGKLLTCIEDDLEDLYEQLADLESAVSEVASWGVDPADSLSSDDMHRLVKIRNRIPALEARARILSERMKTEGPSAPLDPYPWTPGGTP